MRSTYLFGESLAMGIGAGIELKIIVHAGKQNSVKFFSSCGNNEAAEQSLTVKDILQSNKATTKYHIATQY